MFLGRFGIGVCPRCWRTALFPGEVSVVRTPHGQVGTGRFELPTCRLGGDRSIHLSYVPVCSPSLAGAGRGRPAAGPRDLDVTRHFPSVFARYSTIAVTSESYAVAPRATMPRTTASHSAAFILWLVTTSSEWHPTPHVFSTNALLPPGGRVTGAKDPTRGFPRSAAAAAAAARVTETGSGLRETSGSPNATSVLLTGPPRNEPPPEAITATYCRPSRPM